MDSGKRDRNTDQPDNVQDDGEVASQAPSPRSRQCLLATSARTTSSSVASTSSNAVYVDVASAHEDVGSVESGEALHLYRAGRVREYEQEQDEKRSIYQGPSVATENHSPARQEGLCKKYANTPPAHLPSLTHSRRGNEPETTMPSLPKANNSDKEIGTCCSNGVGRDEEDYDVFDVVFPPTGPLGITFEWAVDPTVWPATDARQAIYVEGRDRYSSTASRGGSCMEAAFHDTPDGGADSKTTSPSGPTSFGSRRPSLPFGPVGAFSPSVPHTLPRIISCSVGGPGSGPMTPHHALRIQSFPSEPRLDDQRSPLRFPASSTIPESGDFAGGAASVPNVSALSRNDRDDRTGYPLQPEDFTRVSPATASRRRHHRTSGTQSGDSDGVDDSSFEDSDEEVFTTTRRIESPAKAGRGVGTGEERGNQRKVTTDVIPTREGVKRLAGCIAPVVSRETLRLGDILIEVNGISVAGPSAVRAGIESFQDAVNAVAVAAAVTPRTLASTATPRRGRGTSAADTKASEGTRGRIFKFKRVRWRHSSSSSSPYTFDRLDPTLPSTATPLSNTVIKNVNRLISGSKGEVGVGCIKDDGVREKLPASDPSSRPSQRKRGNRSTLPMQRLSQTSVPDDASATTSSDTTTNRDDVGQTDNCYGLHVPSAIETSRSFSSIGSSGTMRSDEERRGPRKKALGWKRTRGRAQDGRSVNSTSSTMERIKADAR